MFPYSEKWRDMGAISRDDLWNVVNCFVKCTGTVRPLECDPAYLRMKAEIVDRENFRLL